MGLVAALRWYASQRLEPSGIQFHTRVNKMDGRLQPHVEATFYRIAQEALTNVAKHSRAQNVWLNLTRANNHFTLFKTAVGKINLELFDPGRLPPKSIAHGAWSWKASKWITWAQSWNLSRSY